MTLQKVRELEKIAGVDPLDVKFLETSEDIADYTRYLWDDLTSLTHGQQAAASELSDY